MDLTLRSCNEEAKCTMEDCQFPTTKIFCRSKSRVEIMLLTFYIRGIAHYEFLTTGQSTKFTIWKYWKVCVKNVDGNDPNFLQTTHGSCIMKIHLHTRHCLREFIAIKQITVLKHPAYSPDPAPTDFVLFAKIKEILKGRHFDDIDDIRSNTTAALKVIPQNKFQNCFEGWTRHWHR